MVAGRARAKQGLKARLELPRDYVPGLDDMLPVEHPECARSEAGNR